ncbi:hypothetical protein LX36DRAFT_665024 [Colletotrichum falcatum]|nr:hypothetical protein LX36DRAFT_665024 [Colletotrichum falcatum]
MRGFPARGGGARATSKPACGVTQETQKLEKKKKKKKKKKERKKGRKPSDRDGPGMTFATASNMYGSYVLA